MGASIISCTGIKSKSVRVPMVSLSDIVKKYNLKRVDFIKCDIEGAETLVFKDEEFFRNFHPRIIVEPHYLVNGNLSSSEVLRDLSKYGYRIKEIKQYGVDLPLLECI